MLLLLLSLLLLLLLLLCRAAKKRFDDDEEFKVRARENVTRLQVRPDGGGNGVAHSRSAREWSGCIPLGMVAGTRSRHQQSSSCCPGMPLNGITV